MATVIFLLLAGCDPGAVDTPSGTTVDVVPTDTDETNDTDDTGDTIVPFSWPSAALVLPGVQVLDVDGERGPVTVVVDGQHIAAILEGEPEIPDDARVLDDVRGMWVVPGLIDVHVHLFLSGTSVWVGDTLSAHLRQQLAHGVTSVVDVGGPIEAFALRDRIELGEVLGPSLRALGPMVTVAGSHPCEAGYDPEFCALADDREQGRAVVEDLLAAGGDGVKVALADASFTPWPTARLSLEAMDGAVGAAADAGGLTVAHVDEEADALDALDAGVSHLAHPVFGGVLAPAGVSRVAAEATAVHTTLGAFSGTLELLDGTLPTSALGSDPRVEASWSLDAAHPEWFDPAWLDESALWAADADASVEALRAAGALLVPGSDAGYLYVPHGLGLHLEVARLAEQGWSNSDLLRAMTFDAAEAVGWTDRGRISEGLRADLVVVSVDPRVDLATLASPLSVIAAGRAEPPSTWASIDVLQVAAGGGDGTFCVDERDCSSGACDRVAHRCTTSCDAAGQLQDPCGSSASCALEEGITGPPVCRDVRTCDLYDSDGCAPEPWHERCVPLDLDTSGCFEAGPRTVGQSCDPVVASAACQGGLYCSLFDLKCYELCDPQAASDSCDAPRSCVTQMGAGQPWFGLCL